MTSTIVLDASAILALLGNEQGSYMVEELLPSACISAVNCFEVGAVLYRQGTNSREVSQILTEIITEIVPFDFEQSLFAAYFKQQSKNIGLSLGDCACLALAKLRNLPVLTSDRIWKKIAGKLGIEVVLLR